MWLAGEKTRAIGEFVMHVRDPEEREYCRCHNSQTFFCPTPHAAREVYLATDARPRFWISRKKAAEVAA